jgi:hypothetical protein
MNLPKTIVAALACSSLISGCADEAPDPTLLSGDYTPVGLNIESNGCAMEETPIVSMGIETDATNMSMLRFPNASIGEEDIASPSATIVDGGFKLTFSGLLSTYGSDEELGLVDCTLNVRFDIEATIVDDTTWTIDAGTQTLEPVVGPPAACGKAFRDGLDAPGYDPVKGCSRTFTTTMQRGF